MKMCSVNVITNWKVKIIKIDSQRLKIEVQTHKECVTIVEFIIQFALHADSLRRWFYIAYIFCLSLDFRFEFELVWFWIKKVPYEKHVVKICATNSAANKISSLQYFKWKLLLVSNYQKLTKTYHSQYLLWLKLYDWNRWNLSICDSLFDNYSKVIDPIDYISKLYIAMLP